jgi:hypothetical protein
MITITLMGQLQTTDGERDLACELVTINKRIASEDSIVQDGDAVRFVGHDGAGGSGLAPSF